MRVLDGKFLSNNELAGFVSWSLRYLAVPCGYQKSQVLSLLEPKKLQSRETVLPKSGKLRGQLLKLTNVLLLG